MSSASESESAAAVTASLDSVSICLEESPLFDRGPVADAAVFPQPFEGYRLTAVDRERQLLSPRLWSLPEVFGRKLSAFSEHYFNEVNRQNRTADAVRYNFSDGQQISAREILRHPLHRAVPGHLLPQSAKGAPAVFARWPLVLQAGHNFITQALSEIEEVMQLLLMHVAEAHARGQLEVFLQHPKLSGRALKLKHIEFDAAQLLEWRLDLTERPELAGEFKLLGPAPAAGSVRREPAYFPSFAADPEAGLVIVHPWMREFTRLQEALEAAEPGAVIAAGGTPLFEVHGESAVRAVADYLRGRPLPLAATAGSRRLESGRSLTEIQLNSGGEFFIRHRARVPEQKDLLRRGWSATSWRYLRALSQGLPDFLHTDARDLATGSRLRREWDLRLLRHLGILQYLAFETLALYFDGELSDGRKIRPEDMFAALENRVRDLLVAGSEAHRVQNTPLADLCSRPVLAGLEDFTRALRTTLNENAAFYSEAGEVILEGAQEREWRLIYELLKKLAVSTGGEAFRRLRTGFLSKISADEAEAGSAAALFHFPGGDGTAMIRLHQALEALQFLPAHGFQIFVDGQPLLELGEDEFRVDFTLTGEEGQKNFNWFELNPQFFLFGEEVNADQLLSLGGGGVIEYQGRLYLVPKKQIPSLRRLETFWQKLQRGGEAKGPRRNRENIYFLPRHQTLELLALRAGGVNIRGDREWQRLCDFYDRLGRGEWREPELPPSVRAELKPYQKAGLRWLQDLYGLRLGALLADDMGLGKTLQTLGFLEGLRVGDELGHSLIVVPSSLIFNWQNEVQKFTPEIPLRVFSARERPEIQNELRSEKPLVLITTYGLLLEHEEFFAAHRWKVLIFDEAQNIKNIGTRRTGAARRLAAEFKICLTGTPMENHYGEFYSLVDLLVPGSLGPVEDFRRVYVNREGVSAERIEDLRLKIKPLLLRRTKKEILDQLPGKQETTVSLAFEEQQKGIYRDIALAYNQRVQEAMAGTVPPEGAEPAPDTGETTARPQGEGQVQLQMLTALLRLRQACSDPAALPNVRYDKVPPKLETLRESLQEVVESGESALVFTQFLQTLEHGARLLKEAGLPVYVLHGGVPARQRQKLLAEFNARADGAVLLMTLKTGGVGLNLTKASYVFHLEPWWNPAVENQATDRAHRLGQSKAVQVFRYIMHESLEEKIELLKERKDKKFRSLLGGDGETPEAGAGTAGLSKEDFEMLIGLD